MSTETLRAESKKTVRRPVAKVRITWASAQLDPPTMSASEEGRVSYPSQAGDTIETVPYKYAHTNNTDLRLDGTWRVMPGTLARARQFQVGWWGSVNSGAGGVFASPPVLTSNFAQRPIYSVVVAGDNQLSEYPIRFSVALYRKNGGSYDLLETINVMNNEQVLVVVTPSVPRPKVDRMVLTINKWSKAWAVVKLPEFSSSIQQEYDGDDILSLSILEETDSAEGTLPVGNISSNEIDLVLQNIDNSLAPSNPESDLHTMIRRNRVIEPFVGFEYADGSREYVAKGVYWTGDWAASQQDVGASVTARDRLDQLRKATWRGFNPDVMVPAEGTYWENISIKAMIEILLDDFKRHMPDFIYSIDDELAAVVVPLGFYRAESYYGCLKKAVQAGLAYAYMDLPTDAEKAVYPYARDILRVVSAESVLNLSGGAISITDDDFVSLNLPAKSEEISNVVNVVQQTYVLNEEGLPSEDPDNRYLHTVSDGVSIRSHGRLEHTHDSNHLIQTQAQAVSIGQILLSSFALARRNVEIRAFGDPTLRLIDLIEIPEYKKGAVNVTGKYIIRRISTEYTGSLQQEIAGIKGQE